MKISNCLFVSFLLFINFFHSNSNVISTTNLSPAKNKTLLMDLNLDVHLLILDELNLLDLIAVAETNQHLSILAEDVFRRKYSKKLFEIIDPRFDDFENFLDTKDKVYIRQFSLILRIMKQFGHLISHLMILYSSSNKLWMDVASINIISKSINLYCSNTLKHFEIISFRETFFDKMIKPFEKVEYLLIRGKFNNLSSETLDFAELFPEIRHLKVEYVEVEDTSCIDQKFVHIEHLYIEISQHANPRRFSEKQVFKLLNRNPQIRSLELDKSSRTFLMKVNQILPKLESLGLVHYFPFHGESNRSVVFEHVKNFSVAESGESAPKNVEFRNLIEYHTENLPALLCNKWVDFVENSSYLKRLHVENVDDEQLWKLTTIDLNLDEVFFHLNIDVNNETIVKFIKNNQQSKKIHFIRNKMPNTFKIVAKILNQHFGDKWTINETTYSIFLERIRK